MNIGYLQKSSVIEYPGKICCIVFSIGCNFRCPYCHNPELVEPSLFPEQVPHDEIFSFLEKRKGKLDAVSITGGEPTIHSGLISFMKEVKSLGFLVKLDTNGSRPSVVAEALRQGLTDYIAMDIKGPPARYPEITGTACNPADIEKTIRIIMGSGLDYEFRTTMAGSLLTPQDLREMGTMIRGASRYVIQRFTASKHLDPAYKELGLKMGEGDIDEIKAHLAGLVGRLIVR